MGSGRLVECAGCKTAILSVGPRKDGFPCPVCGTRVERGQHDAFGLLAPVAAVLALPFVLLDPVGLALCGLAVVLGFVGLCRTAVSHQRGMWSALLGMALGILFVYPILLLGPW